MSDLFLTAQDSLWYHVISTQNTPIYLHDNLLALTT